MSDANQQAYIPASGMTRDHFEAFQQAAQEEKVIAIVRNTNAASTRLIEQGCPGKPLTIKFHTNESTGVVTAQNPAEAATARQLGYLVVDSDRIARGTFLQNGRPVQQELRLSNPFWRLEAGQVIDPKLRKPLVGDYDLMGVISARNPGQNIALVASDGERVQDVSSPIVKRFADRVNTKLDRPRVLHGAQDQFAGFRGGATVFSPDGRVLFLADEFAVKEFYEMIGRQTMRGSYRMPVGGGIPTVSGRWFVQSGKAQGVLRNQAAMGMLGQALGAGIQLLGDYATRQRVEQELQTTHAATIASHLSNGNGVLIVIRMQEWIVPDFNGMRARGLLGVYIEAGLTRQDALNAWNKPRLIQPPPDGWRAFEQFVWVDPHL